MGRFHSFLFPKIPARPWNGERQKSANCFSFLFLLLLLLLSHLELGVIQYPSRKGSEEDEQLLSTFPFFKKGPFFGKRTHSTLLRSRGVPTGSESTPFPPYFAKKRKRSFLLLHGNRGREGRRGDTQTDVHFLLLFFHSHILPLHASSLLYSTRYPRGKIFLGWREGASAGLKRGGLSIERKCQRIDVA